MKNPGFVLLLVALLAGVAPETNVTITRFTENPLITLDMSPTIGDNANGPSVIRVPDWVEHPLGRYYMYFAHHKGMFIRLAYADSLHGPWKIYEPGVMKVEDSGFYRPQPDPADSPPGFYTHIASPDIYLDEANRQIIMWTHGVWTEGRRWPENRADARKWARQNGYFQYSQASVSADGLHFEARPAISRECYLRVFQYNGMFYAVSRLGELLRAGGPLQEFKTGGNPFRGTRFSGHVRHVAILREGDVLHLFFSTIGDAPESILYTTIDLAGEWTAWKIGDVRQVLTPEASYECPELPVEPSAVGAVNHPVREVRDPALFEEDGKIFLFYTFCGEQGIAGAEVKFLK